MKWFWLNSINICESTITGSEAFSGKMLGPKSESVVLSGLMLNLIVRYYTATYEMYNFCKLADEVSHDSITIRVKIDKFGRC